MVERMRGFGLAADLQPVADGRFNAIGTLAGSGGGRSLMFNGHMGTNPVTDGGPERLTRTERRLLRCGDGAETTPCTR